VKEDAMANASGSFRWRGGLLLAALVLVLLSPAGPRPAAGSPQTPPGGAASTAASSEPIGGSVDYARDREAIFDAFYTIGLETGAPLAVSDLAIRKDNVTLLLKRGTVFLAKPIAGEITGLAFIGEGEMSMTPPNRTERYMLKKYSGSEILKEPFTEAVFRFTDGAHRTIIGAGKPDPQGAALAARAEATFRGRNGFWDGSRYLALEMRFLEARISGLKGLDFFLAGVRSPKHDWLNYYHDPQETIEHSLYTTESMGGGGRRYRVTWAEWHDSQEYAPSGHYVLHPDRDGPRAIRIPHYEMTLDIPTTKSVDWKARLRIEAVADGVRALRMDCTNNLDWSGRWHDTGFYPTRVLEVTDESGQPLPFMHRRDELLVLLPAPLAAGTNVTLGFKGKADVIYQLTAESFGLLQAAWYPQYGYLHRHTFDWTAWVSRPFLITGSGKRQRELEDKERGMNGLQMASTAPVTFPWLIFGRFNKVESPYSNDGADRRVRLTIHSFPNMTISITDPAVLDLIGASAPVTISLSAPVKKLDGFFGESKEILKLFEKIYGPYPYDELHIAQMAPQLGFGQAPPGFIQLTGVAFMSQARVESDFIHGFLSHEIAHQWWGNQVGWASEDDEWISESFAEYASGIFVKELQGEKRFQRTLEEWRRNAKYSDHEGPIAAANHLGGLEGGRHRYHLLYGKGPYVLHMLRVQLNDEKYVEVMRAIQETYKHQNISTEMLLREVNRVTKADYTPFFDQWVWDVGIPTFRYRWRSEKQPDGKFLITVNVRQDDKNNIKKVLMPVHIHFKDKMIPQYKPLVQAEQEIKIMSPMEPKNVTLDDDRTLLAEIVRES
jgi:hypothetical protein